MENARETRVVVLAPVGADANAMAAMLTQNGFPAVVGRTAAECRDLIEAGAGAVLLTEEALQLPDATALAMLLREQPPWSDLPVLILTSGGPQRLALLLDHTAQGTGSILLLERPTAAAVLLRAVRVALQARGRQYQMRELLSQQRRREAELEQARQTAERELQRRQVAEEALGRWLETPLPHEARATWTKIIVATAITAAAVLIRAVADPLLQEQLPVATMFGAVALVVWFSGLWPAVVSGVVGFIVCEWFFVAHRHAVPVRAEYAYHAVLFAIVSGLIIAIGVRMRTAQRRARVNGRISLHRQRSAERALQERDRAEAKLHAADERLRLAVKNARITVAETDRELRYRWVLDPEPAAGVTDRVGRRDDEIDPSPAGRRLLELKQRVLQTGHGLADDLSFTGPGGTRTVAVTLEPLRDTAGEIVGVTSAALDVSDRRRAEHALRASEERARQQAAELEAIYEAAPIGLAVVDTELRYRRINERLARINGIPAADHVGRSVADVVPSLGAQAAEVMRRIRETGRPVRSEFKGDTKADPGVERIWDQHWYPLHQPGGPIVGVAVMAEEVTEQRRNEQALRESEELFRALAENGPQLTWMARPDGWIFWYNRRWFDYTGTTMEDMEGWGWQRVHHPDHVERVTDGFRHAMTHGTAWEDTFPLRRKDGRYRWFLSRAFPIRDTVGRITRWFGSNTDITVLRDTQEALREAQRQIREYADGLERTVAERTAKLQETVQELEAFSYSIAHDMRAPLRSMIGYAEIVREEHAAGMDETGRRYLDRIAASSRRLDRLILDVLNYSRIVRDDLPLEPVDLRSLVREVIDSYPNLAAVADRVQVGELPALIANRAALTQVLSNLLENAVKFVASGVTPSVRVFAEPATPPRPDARGSWCRVSVEDNGIGIDPTVVPRLFEMFQRFTRPGLYEGTGMGLAIVRKAVLRMGGTVGVESTPGTGSRFWFVLPRVAETNPSLS
jgi:PAS domain S-box-containing protein